MFFSRVAAVAVLLSVPLLAQAPAAKSQAPAAAAALPDARTIVDRHIKAVGGRQAVLAHKSMHATGTLSIPASGISGPVDIYGAAPDSVLVRTSVQGIGEIIDGFDGTHGWSISPMTGPTLKAGKELEQTKLDADFYSELRDPKKYTLKTVEKTTYDGRDCYKISVKRIDGSEDFDFYDVATGLRAGSINTRETQMGTMTVSNVESGYKKFGALTQATVLTQKIMGVEQRITIETVEYDKVDSSMFEPPAAIKALIK
ncbi:MAG TPA: hypothetical protein VGI12_17860 [Vicinamibacterales bacterium]|jgi:hypothetical protein